MAKVSPFHSKKNPGVYHVCSNCTEGTTSRRRTQAGLDVLQGEGVPADDAEAVKWFRLAAEQSDANAQTSLGVMYFAGKGLPADSVRAYMWLNLARVGGSKQAAYNLGVLEKMMTPEQIAEGQRLSHEWSEKHGGAETEEIR